MRFRPKVATVVLAFTVQATSLAGQQLRFGDRARVRPVHTGSATATAEWREVSVIRTARDTWADRYQSVAQDAYPLSIELGLGSGRAGHGEGFSAKVAVRVIPRTWGLGVRLMAMDGARRGGKGFLGGGPIESFTEKSVLVHRRIVTSDGSRIYIGAGVGRLSGRRFIGSSLEFDRNVSELGMSVEASTSVPPGAGIRFALAVQGHIGPGGVTASFTVGVAVGG